MTRRTERVNELLREEIASLVLNGIKDPRVAHGLVSITEVVVSSDLRHATVFVSHLGEASDRRIVLEGLQRSGPWMRDALGHRLRMKRVPELVFRHDPSLERGARLSALIHQVGEGEHGEEEAS